MLAGLAERAAGHRETGSGAEECKQWKGIAGQTELVVEVGRPPISVAGPILRIDAADAVAHIDHDRRIQYDGVPYLRERVIVTHHRWRVVDRRLAIGTR